MSEPPKYTATLSHQIEAGPSGPARSYWDIRSHTSPDTRGLKLGTVCLHHHDDMPAEGATSEICYMLQRAFDAGRMFQAATVREALNYGRRQST